MNLVTHAEAELTKAGLFKEDSDYNGMIGKAVLELMKSFSKQGHSGFSAMLTLDVFSRLAKWKTLTPITDNPEEWNDVSDMSGSKEPFWQNKRQPDCFSKDGGKTYYSLDELEKLEKTFLYRTKKFLYRLIGKKNGAWITVKPTEHFLTYQKDENK